MTDLPDPDEQLGRRLASELRRYEAPASLRVKIVESIEPARSRRPAWLSPLLAAAATAMVLAMFMLGWRAIWAPGPSRRAVRSPSPPSKAGR